VIMSTRITPAMGSEYASPAVPAISRMASMASVPYATDERASEDSMASALTLLRRSSIRALVASGGPSTRRRTLRATRVGSGSAPACTSALTSSPGCAFTNPSTSAIRSKRLLRRGGRGTARSGSIGRRRRSNLRPPSAASQCLPISAMIASSSSLRGLNRAVGLSATGWGASPSSSPGPVSPRRTDVT
jgi:hypothetical protein